MGEKFNMTEVVDEIKNASESELKEVIERWFDKTRMDGLKMGAQMISLVVDEAIQKNLTKGYNSSLRDYQRAIKRIVEITSVQLKRQETVQNDLETEEVTDDGTAE